VSAARKARSAAAKGRPRLLPSQDCELMLQHEQLGVLGELAAPPTREQAQQSR